MSISSVSSTAAQAYIAPKASAPVSSTPKTAVKDADGDNDGTTATKAAAYKSGSAIDVEG